MKTPHLLRFISSLFWKRVLSARAGCVCMSTACMSMWIFVFKLKIFIRADKVRMIFFLPFFTPFALLLPNKNQTVFADEKICSSFLHLLLFSFWMRFIRKLNPLNLENIALSFGSFNRMNYGQTNWNDNNLMYDINPNSTRKLTSFSM